MLKVFAVRDVKADAYGALVTCPTRGLALRMFADACFAQGSPMAKYPEDYTLYEIGEFDPSSGTLTGLRLPELVASAVDVMNSVPKEALAAAEVK